MVNTRWDPQAYLSFAHERSRAAYDLAARVPKPAPKFCVDLGCGPGNSTAALCARFPHADVLGLDSSAEMLAQAGNSGLSARFGLADFETWTPARDAVPEVIFSNAAFQWASHPLTLVQRLFGVLPPGGVLAFQVPQNFDQPSHLTVDAVATEGPWAEALAGAKRYDPGDFARAEDYANALMGHGTGLDIWTTEYLHILSGPDAVFSWLYGTALRPFVQRLEGSTRRAFEQEIKVRLNLAYPASIQADGTLRTLFPFRRLFVVASKPEAVA
jgi:trans-aconitate 2-methyltransferase